MAVLILALTVFASTRFLHWAAAMEHHEKEVSSLPMHEGEAEVVSVSYMQGTRAVPVKEPVYRVRFRGRDFMVQGSTDARLGDLVHVGYRESGSGEIYVESIGGVVYRR